MVAAQRYIVDLKNADEDGLLLGEYGYELTTLTSLKINVPPTFIITTEAYFEFINQNNLRQKVNHLINAGAERKIKKLFLDSEIPEYLVDKIFKAYRGLGKLFADEFVTLTPSLTDSNDFFKHSSVKIKGEATLLQSIKKFWASYFDSEHFLHRQNRNLNHFRTGIAVIVQKELKPRKLGNILIEGGQNKIITKNKLTDEENAVLLEIGQEVKSLHYFPKKVNWVLSKGKIYITKLSPVAEIPEPSLAKLSVPKGRIVTGAARVIENEKDMDKITYGEVLVIQALKKYDDIKALRQAKALVVRSKINNPHIKLVLDQMGIPVVVDKEKEKLRNGMIITVDAGRGEIYQGGFRG